MFLLKLIFFPSSTVQTSSNICWFIYLSADYSVLLKIRLKGFSPVEFNYKDLLAVCFACYPKMWSQKVKIYKTVCKTSNDYCIFLYFLSTWNSRSLSSSLILFVFFSPLPRTNTERERERTHAHRRVSCCLLSVEEHREEHVALSYVKYV